jgi:hypothetical protein
MAMDRALTWFIRIWIAALVVVNIIEMFFLPDSYQALFYIGWAPIFPIPDLSGSLIHILWIASNLVLMIPAAGAAAWKEYRRGKKPTPNI